MTSIEDWSLSTLSFQIFRQQTQLQLQPGNSNFLVVGPAGRRQGYNCNLETQKIYTEEISMEVQLKE